MITEKLIKGQNTFASVKTVDLVVKKYKREVFFKNLWDQHPECIKARGAVFIDGKQVVFPMDKCFNYGENNTGIDLPKDKKIVAYKKLNGFMANLTWVSDVGWVISTTGDAITLSTWREKGSENKYLNMAAKYIELSDGFAIYNNLELENGKTLTFEVCHPDDPHIVVEEFGLHPLCYQANGKTYPLNVQGERFEGTVQEILDYVKTVEHEGYMVYDADSLDLLFKLKSPYYLAKKWIQRGGVNKVWSDNYKQRIDEEYYPIIEYIRGLHSKDEWCIMSESEKSDAFYNAMYFLKG